MSEARIRQSGHSPNIERYSPAYIFEGLGIRFDLDPCAPPPEIHCPSKDWCDSYFHQFSGAGSGLLRPWHGRVWLNPPFARNEVGKWIGKLNELGNGIALVTSYFTSRWFQDNPPDGIFLLAKRPRYEVPKADKSTVEGRYASMLMSYGPECTKILCFCNLEGKFYRYG